ERVDHAMLIVEIPDEDRIAEGAEIRGRFGDAPRRGELAALRGAFGERAVGVEDADGAAAQIDGIRGRSWNGVGDEQLAVHVYDIERVETRRHRRIGKAAGERRLVEALVEDIDGARGVVGGVEKAVPAARADGDAGVSVSRGCGNDRYRGGALRAVPRGD